MTFFSSSKSSSRRKPGSRSSTFFLETSKALDSGFRRNDGRDDVYIVGGAVRDRILGRETIDFDLVTPKNPTSLAEKLAKKFGGTSFVLDQERGVIRVALPEGIQFDFAQRQGKTFEDDLDRRDFSINALAIPLTDWSNPNWKKKIIDRHQGLLDLQRKKIALISPGIFKEDPLRLLRAFRIAAELNFNISPQTLSTIKINRRLLKKSAPERIRDEVLRTFTTEEAHSYLVLMEKSGLLDILLPEADKLRRTAARYYGRGGVLKHTLDSFFHLEEILRTLKKWFPKAHNQITADLNQIISGYPRRAHLKWAVLLHDLGKPATAKMIKGRLRFFEHEHVGANKIPKLAKRFRWSSDETHRYAKLVRNHMRPGNLASHPEASDKAFHRFFRDLGDDAVGMLLVSLGDHLSYLTPKELKRRMSPHELITKKMISKYFFSREKVLPPKILTGHDIMNAFDLTPSPLIGTLMEDLIEAQSEGNIKTKEEALTYLRGRL